MADYPSIDPRAFGRTNTLPQAVSRLPVNLTRTALVTRQPQKTVQAVEQYRQAMLSPEYTAPMNLPQRMLFQQHKSDTGGVSRGGPRVALSSAMTLSAALMPTQVSGGFSGLSAVSTVSLRVPEQVPTYAQAQASNARGAQAFPQPGQTLSVPGPQARVRPFRQPIAPPLEAYGDTLAESQQMHAADEAFRAGNAMRGVELAKARVRAILGY